jgi:hypothetical protein
MVLAHPLSAPRNPQKGVVVDRSTSPSSRLRPKGAAADLWRHTLSQIPSLFGRLVYLSSLRDPNTGLYQHHGLATVFGEEEANAAMRLSHENTFAQWLESPLEQQKSDLDLYVAGLEPARKRVVETWSRLEPYRNLPPASAKAVEKSLFLTDLETLLSLMRNELGVASTDPSA